MLRWLFLGSLFVLPAVPAAAQAECHSAIAQFRQIIDSDAQTGNVNKSVYNRMLPELARITQTCDAGHGGPAVSALSALKHRYGYR
ncbi:MAG: hypothetical protein AB7O60_19405 [Variibacter sp.]